MVFRGPGLQGLRSLSAFVLSLLFGFQLGRITTVVDDFSPQNKQESTAGVVGLEHLPLQVFPLLQEVGGTWGNLQVPTMLRGPWKKRHWYAFAYCGRWFG